MFTFKILVAESKRRPFSGKILQLGKQDVAFNYVQMFEVFNELGYEPTREDEFVNERSLEANVTDSDLFSALGFDEVLSSDVSDYEGADYIIDLNSGQVSEDLVGGFDVLYDGGTLEHVFHLPNALSSIYMLLKEGGRIIHHSPSSNHIDHGFYMFSPTFFHDYYSYNKFQVNSSELLSYSIPQKKSTFSYPYVPSIFDTLSLGGFDASMYLVCFTATKTSDSTNGKIPQQFIYRYEYYKNSNGKDHRSSLDKMVRVILMKISRDMYCYLNRIYTKYVYQTKQKKRLKKKHY